MAPAPSAAIDSPLAAVESADPPGDREAFIADLSSFHGDRGTSLDLHPKVHSKPVDLFELFQVVQARGGYDEVSAEKLAWRKVGEEFNFGNSNQAAYAFALKTVFYRNLAAYAINRVYKREPPPIRILEALTAKGGDLLTRTPDTFTAHGKSRGVHDAQESENEEDEARQTPKQERLDNADDPGSGTGRRGLRQAPPQRQIFQPDVSSTRQPRQTSSQTQIPPNPTPAMANHHIPTPQAYPSTPNGTDLKPQVPMGIKIVPTPASDPARFAALIHRRTEEQRIRLGRAPSPRPTMLPGTGFDGPNIYVRTLLALRSTLPQEQDYALHHLVKISHERGDKYKFEAFPGLADGLTEKLLEIASLFYEVQWEISYSDDAIERQLLHVLDGLKGTPDLLARIGQLKRRDASDNLQTEEFAHKLLKCNEAGLVVRNMAMLKENATYLADHHPLRDFLVIALNLPKMDSVVEMTHYALEIAEQVSKHWPLGADDPLYVSLLQIVTESSDRGAILTALRALCRTSMALDEPQRTRPLHTPAPTIKRLLRWLFLDDDELVAAALDFLYQYTLVPANLPALLSDGLDNTVSGPQLVQRLCTLLQTDARPAVEQTVLRPAAAEAPTEQIPELPADVLRDLLRRPEPERSRAWLRACFAEDAKRDMTQLQLWQAYQARFANPANAAAQQHQYHGGNGGGGQPPPPPPLVASDFIKNVSEAFAGAVAHVTKDPQTGQARYIIKGICPRAMPHDPRTGRPLLRCLWGAYRPCGQTAASARALHEHVMTAHLGVHRDPGSSGAGGGGAGAWDIEDAARNAERHEGHLFTCQWARCQHFAARGGGHPDPFVVGMHVKTHLPDADPPPATPTDSTSSPSTSKKHAASSSLPAVARPHNKRSRLVGPADLATPPAPWSWEASFAAGPDEALVRRLAYRDAPLEAPAEEGREPELVPGVGLTACLVLRNLARNIPRALDGADAPGNSGAGNAEGAGAADGSGEHGNGGGGGGGTKDAARGEPSRAQRLLAELFLPHRRRLDAALAHNRTLAGPVFDVLAAVERGLQD